MEASAADKDVVTVAKNLNIDCLKKIYSVNCNIVFRHSNEHGYIDSSHSKGDKPVYKAFGTKAKKDGTCAL